MKELLYISNKLIIIYVNKQRNYKTITKLKKIEKIRDGYRSRYLIL